MEHAATPQNATPQSGTNEPDRVADAPSGNWVYRYLPRSLWPYAQLARWDRPIGWWLLLWPCWWSLALSAGQGGSMPTTTWQWAALLAAFAFFWLGAVAMRGAGCSYNDLVDAKIDAQVARTASRPIPSGRVSRKSAVIFVALQLLTGLAALLALCALPFEGRSFNSFALALAFASLVVVLAYPFAKRVTHWPQFVLGLAFSWGALLGWAVLHGTLAAPAMWLYGGAIVWTIGYDTIYAHQDKEDDILIGVRSTALLFDNHTQAALMALYGATLLLFGMAFYSVDAGWPAYLGLALAAAHMGWQLARLDINDSDKCLAIFKSNRDLGWLVFAGLLVDLFA